MRAPESEPGRGAVLAAGGREDVWARASAVWLGGAEPSPGAPSPYLDSYAQLSSRMLSGEIERETLLDQATARWALPAVDVRRVRPSSEALSVLPRAEAERLGMLPLALDEQELRVAVCDPRGDCAEALEALAFSLGLSAAPALALPTELRTALGSAYEGAGPAGLVAPRSGAEPFPAPEETKGFEEPSDERLTPEDAPIVLRLQEILADAVRRRASDVHLEPMETRFRVRYRIDGVLVEAGSPPRALQRALLSRLKIMANLSIAERRLPQDGRLSLVLEGRPVELRVATLPTVHGESAVVRLLRSEESELGLEQLGIAGADLAALDALLACPHGLVLVTGPTGSGKTTTLYGCLRRLNRSERKILTVEDPVEGRLRGVNQVPVRPEIGLTFPVVLRSLLRQAPNVILVGEIRDPETAEIAVNAALTGHLVLSSLHTADAAGAVVRLLDLGVKPFLLSAALRGVVAQRLLRKLCLHCREEVVPEVWKGQALGEAPVGPAEGQAYARGAGCALCQGSGYFGRTAVVEILRADEGFAQKVHESAPLEQLRRQARALGAISLRQAALGLARRGTTSLDEVAAETSPDD